jgi:hypothetical protein
MEFSQLSPSGQVTYLAPTRARYQSEVDKRIGDDAAVENVPQVRTIKSLIAAATRIFGLGMSGHKRLPVSRLSWSYHLEISHGRPMLDLYFVLADFLLVSDVESVCPCPFFSWLLRIRTSLRAIRHRRWIIDFSVENS